MAERHVRGVQMYSDVKDDRIRHVLEVIALDIGHDDSPARTSYRKIARRSRCSPETVQLRIQHLIECGELIQQKDGQLMLYSLNHDLIPYGRTSSRENSGSRSSGFRVVNCTDLERMEAKILQAQEIVAEKLYQKLYQSAVLAVLGDQRNGGTEVLVEELKEKDPPISPMDDLELLKARYKTALASGCKTVLSPGFNEEKYEKAAEWCIDNSSFGLSDDEKLETINRFPTYWRDRGWGGLSGPPTLELMLSELGNCYNNVDTRNRGKDVVTKSSTSSVSDEYGGHSG